MREAFTAVITLAEEWSGVCESEPYEVGWAGEAVVFVRAVETSGGGGAPLAVCISPDGVNWVDEGTVLPLPEKPGKTVFTRLAHFGHFLKFRADLPAGARAKYIITLSLKE